MAEKLKPADIIRKGVITDNPALVQVIGMCPTLAVTTSANDGIGMGLATTAVLVASNFFISLIKNIVPDKVRIPAYIIVIASFVTLIQFVLQAYLPALNDSLGIFIPLIVVNCIILARAEAFASKNSPIDSVFDGIGMGLGFTVALFIIGAIREFFGKGSILGLQILSEEIAKTVIFILPPGAFITLGFVMAFLNYTKGGKK